MITLGLTYYNSRRLFEYNKEYYTKIGHPEVRFIVVDDGSQDDPLTADDMPENWSLYTITEDVGWNNEGAKNLIMHVAETKWVFLLDIDHVLFPGSFYHLPKLISPLEYNQAPFFRRVINVESGGKVTPNLDPLRQMAANSYAITKQYFWELGGYDESLQGLYGYDGTMVKKLGKRNSSRLDIGLTGFTYGGGGSSWTREEKDLSKEKCKIAGSQIGGSVEERLRFPWKKVV